MIKAKAMPLGEIKKNFSEVVRRTEKGEISIVLKRSKPTSVIIPFKMLKDILGEDEIKELLFEAFFKQEIENRVLDAISGNNIISEEEAKKELGWK